MHFNHEKVVEWALSDRGLRIQFGRPNVSSSGLHCVFSINGIEIY